MSDQPNKVKHSYRVKLRIGNKIRILNEFFYRISLENIEEEKARGQCYQEIDKWNEQLEVLAVMKCADLSIVNHKGSVEEQIFDQPIQRELK